MQYDYSGEIITVDTGTDKIKATSNHPFYVLEGKDLAVRLIPEDIGTSEINTGTKGRWVKAGELRTGDKLKLFDRVAIVKNITRMVKTVKVYNFTVKDNHNYVVGSTHVLVHNKCSVIRNIRVFYP